MLNLSESLYYGVNFLFRMAKVSAEGRFLSGLIKLHYNRKVVPSLRQLSRKISWAEGWPKSKSAFWNAEAFMWEYQVEKEKRELIQKELRFLCRNGRKNLDLGCGSYSYLLSVGMDLSEKMLQLNENITKAVVGSLEKKLPFRNKMFDSVTLIFVLNYIKNYFQLLREVQRTLKPRGVLVMVLYSKNINSWQKQKEVNHFSAERWRKVLSNAGFAVNFKEKEGLWFFKCEKKKKKPY